VVTAKALPGSTPSLPDLLKPFVTPGFTTIVLVQNGVGIEDGVSAAWPANAIISCVTWIGATQIHNGVVQHVTNVTSAFGLFDQPRIKGKEAEQQERLQKIAEIMKAGGGNPEIHEDIQNERWYKVMWNAAWNSLTALSGVDIHRWLDASPASKIVTRRLMQEIVNIAEALGRKLPADAIEFSFARVERHRPIAIYTSMQGDAEHGRAMEVEVILGNPLRKAKELGIDTPILETVYALVRAVDLRNEATRAQKKE